jgi:hypothetical protein
MKELGETGVTVLPNVFSSAVVAEARLLVLGNLDLMANTRRTPNSRHLAGFHRFKPLKDLHEELNANPLIQSFMSDCLGPNHYAIGLSDITINRSQQWHKDLLRGRFQHYLGEGHDSASNRGKCFKIIQYLQDSDSLCIVPGSHKTNIPLESDSEAIPLSKDLVQSISVQAGDALILDICLTHRGSPASAFHSAKFDETAKILVSTVIGRRQCDFATQMRVGNEARLLAWDRRHRSNSPLPGKIDR